MNRAIGHLETKLASLVREICRAVEMTYLEKRRKGGKADIEHVIASYKHRRKHSAAYPEGKALMDAVFKEVDSYLLKKYARTTVSFLGPLATFTHQAAKDYFGSFVDLKPEKNVTDVFQEVEKGNSDFGVVPVENSIEGAVTHTLDLCITSRVDIYSEMVLPIRQNLFSRKRLPLIRAVYSHPQVFGQCRNWLRSHLPNAALIETSSTSEAVRMIQKKKSAAAIGSALCRDIYRVPIAAESIQDDAGNTTRFLIISRRKNRRGARNKTSIVYLVKDKPGALFDSLKPFKERGVNLVKIESRPSKMRAWEYYFFVDMEGFVTDRKIAQALSELRERCVFLKILGSYPVA
jgi:chorismate mutase/prephenate dehydratase